MTEGAKAIFVDVIRVMQRAEERGGPEGKDYVTLMHAIADEARARADRCAEQERGPSHV